MSSYFYEARPAYTGEFSYEIDVKIDGTGDLTSWQFTGKLYQANGIEIPNAVTAQMTDIPNRIATLTITGQTVEQEYRWELRRTDDASNFVVAIGSLEIMSPVAFSHWQQIKERVASGLGVASSDLAAQWDSLCSRGYKDAAAELRRLFIVKGYSPDQFSQWSDFQIYVEMLGSYMALQRGTSLASYDRRGLEVLDPRKEIKDAAALVIGNTAVAAGGTDVGSIVSGSLAVIDEIECEARRRGIFR